MKSAHAIAVLSLLFSQTLSAGEVSEDFSTAHSASGTTGVWNLTNQTLHVPFVVDRSAGTVANQENESVTIGSGSDGEFNATTANSFDLNGGAAPGTITLDTSRIYEFTHFTLPAGTTLLGSGSSPLRLRVQGNATIDGTIDLRGGNGGDSFTPAAATQNRGVACCGGGVGGAGPNGVQTFATNGTSPDGTTLAGQAGTVSAAGGTDGGAGGGGGNRYAGTDGAANAVASGAAGPAFGDETLTTLLGGSGGGGGAGNSNVGTGGPGGGGGGGALSLQVGGNVLLSATGQILVTGGNGGVLANAAHKAGGGGGGGGGSVLIYGGGTGTDNGTIDATGGLGGTAFVQGGDGGGGVIRYAFSGGEFTGTGTENPPPSLLPKPKVVYSQSSYQIVSGIYDTGSSHPHYTALVKEQTLHSGDSITYELAGSSDNFVSDDTGYVSETALARLEGKRYFRFRATLKSAHADSSPTVQKLTLQYKNLFEFSLVGCARASLPPSGKKTPWGWAILVAYCVAFSVWWQRVGTKR